MILVFVSDKGGVGKTTTVINTAVYLMRKNINVIIVKADKNNDLFAWRDLRNDAGFKPIPIYEAYGDISESLKKIEKLCDVLLVDCAGHDSSEFRSALTVADTVITTVKPSSMLERNTLTAVTGKIRKAQSKHGNPNMKAYVLMTRVLSRKLSSAVALDKELRSDEIWLQPLKTRISEYDIFENAVNEGVGVHEVAKASSLNNAKAQIELFVHEIGIIK
ncbi:AAA family ATPase [Proteus mirabilis]|uniref:ParA family protein n=1 Tax=Proteus mirabilis TaxID=584 RepID=UPI001A280973|nr:ParA family protein [Proteus mirabilis]HEM8285999.1 ParA family protein [Providencia stuartii]EKU3804076.1 ParA family protein [Proteus mirabilis]EKV7963312.1 ParA family protein [Proteus mirabilis]ELB1172026.1 ParA family protein [Proteus mirabilis]ELB2631246.1 ParA family protein [Proteus mirabilis]